MSDGGHIVLGLSGPFEFHDFVLIAAASTDVKAPFLYEWQQTLFFDKKLLKNDM